MNDDNFNQAQQQFHEQALDSQRLPFKERLNLILSSDRSVFGTDDRRKQRRKLERKIDKLKRKAA